MDMNETQQLFRLLQIRYIKLHFCLRILEDTILPKNKVSAIRGGIGEMLLRMNCIRDRDCERCGFLSECIVRRIMYSQPEIRPEFMHKGDSMGYVIECENYEEEFQTGEVLEFHLLLFGKNVVYFNQYMQALSYLGMEGIGKYQSKFMIESVTNTNREILAEHDNIYIENYMIRTVAQYVEYRMKTNRKEDILIFHTPLSAKYKGKIIEEFDMEAIMAAVSRRIYMIDCFEGIDEGKADITGHVPKMVSQNVRNVFVGRYSSTHDEKIWLRGIHGSIILEDIDMTARMLLYAGELMHIGKKTSFGFGRYSLAENKRI